MAALRANRRRCRDGRSRSPAAVTYSRARPEKHRGHAFAPRHGLVLALVLLFAVNIGGGAFLSTARIDLTEHRLFTLSPGTRSLLAGLDEPLTMRLYVSRDAAKRCLA